MTKKERLLKTIKHEETDRVPVSPRICAWTKEYYGCDCWMHLLKSAKEFDYECLIELGGNAGEKPPINSRKDIQEYTDRFIITTTEIETPAGKLSRVLKLPNPGLREFGIAPNPQIVEKLVKGKDDLPKLKYLYNPESLNIKNFNLAKFNLKEIAEIVGDEGLIEVSFLAPPGYLCNELGVEEAMLTYFDDKKFIVDLLRVYQDYMLANTKIFLEAGIKIVFGSWYQASMSAGWSPQIFRELFLPLIKEHVDLVHSYNAYYHYYDDGKVMDIVKDLKECGIDMLSTLCPAPAGDADLKKLKEEIGDRVCLKGYIDLVNTLLRGTPETIDAKVKEAMETGKKGGGFILGTSDSIRDGTPLENVRAYFNAARKYGKY